MNYLKWSAASVALMIALSACKAETALPENVTSAQTVEAPTSSNAEASDKESKVLRGAVPAWVKAHALPEYPEDRADQTRNGIEYLLTDDQYRHDTGGYQYASRVAFRVSDRKGLETAAQIKTSFDPSLSELTFNFINVIRDGKTTNRLPGVEIREIQQESGLGNGIIDGDITALINLEDIRVGDILDYGYSGRINTPLYPDMFFSTTSASYSVPIARSFVSYDMPREKRLYTESIKSNVRTDIQDIDDRTIYSFDLIDPDPHRSFKNIPDGVVTQGSFLVSTEDNWSNIADWAVEVYDIDLTLPKSAKAQIKSIKREHKSDGARALAALQWVQDDIRYLGFEEGVNGHKPRTPAATIANGYGDCKDKSLLLQTALSEMGITSYVTLVNTTTGDLLDQTLPAVTMFDHAIVMAELNDRNVFMDPTGTYQRGTLETFGEPDYGFVLPIKSGQSKLVKVDIPFEAYPLQTIKERYTYQEEGSVSLEVTSTYDKQDANSIRRKLAQQGVAKLTESYHDYYAERYPGLKVSSNIQVEDNERKNQIVISESYLLDADTVKSAKYDERIEVKAYSINSKLPDFVEPGRDFALALNKGVKLRHVIEVVTPGREFPDQEDTVESIAGVDFKLDYQSNDDVFSLVYDLSIQEDRISLSDASDMIELAETVETLASRSINLKVARTPLYKRLGLNEPIEQSTLEEIQAIGRLINEKENVDALERVRKLSQSHTKPDALRGFIQQLRASVLIDLGRENAALPILDEAFSLFDPLDQQSYFSYSGLQNSKENYTGAAETLGRLFTNFPEASKGLRMEWMWALYRNLNKAEEFEAKDKLMISLAKAQLANLEEIEPTDRVFGAAILALGRLGKDEDAKAFYPHLHDASTYRDILMDREMEALWDSAAEIAGEGLVKARQAEVEHARNVADTEDAGYRDYMSLVLSYLSNGQSEEAIKFAEPIFENWDRLIAEGEDGFWFAGAYASALSQNGQYQKSDDVNEKLMSIGLGQEASLISMAINYMTDLVGRGEFERALEMAERYEVDDDFDASDFGMTYLWYVKACSQFQLGQTDSAAATYEDNMLPIADENLGAKTITLACMERDDDVAQTLIERLESQTHRAGTLSIYVDDTIPLHQDSFTIEQSTRIRKIADRPEVRRVFDKYGRSISVTGPSEVWAEF